MPQQSAISSTSLTGSSMFIKKTASFRELKYTFYFFAFFSVLGMMAASYTLFIADLGTESLGLRVLGSLCTGAAVIAMPFRRLFNTTVSFLEQPPPVAYKNKSIQKIAIVVKELLRIVAGIDKQTIIAPNGGNVIASNHALGAIDGLVIATVLKTSDGKGIPITPIAGNHLNWIPGIQRFYKALDAIEVDFSTHLTGPSKNEGVVTASKEAAKRGDTVVFFPAGAVQTRGQRVHVEQGYVPIIIESRFRVGAARTVLEANEELIAEGKEPNVFLTLVFQGGLNPRAFGWNPFVTMFFPCNLEFVYKIYSYKELRALIPPDVNPAIFLTTAVIKPYLSMCTGADGYFRTRGPVHDTLARKVTSRMLIADAEITEDETIELRPQSPEVVTVAVQQRRRRLES